MMVARPMGMVPKNIETVEWPKIRRASSKNSSQRAAYSAVNNRNRKMLNSQRTSAMPCKTELPMGNCASAKASTPVPMVAANQFGVNWRITSRGCCRWLKGLIPGLAMLGHVMANSCPLVRWSPS
ncbi:hypothetical protein D3C71_1220390 [compost metagenome]